MADAIRTVLICGFGAFGELHLGAWRRLDPRMRLMVADPSQAALERAAAHGVERSRLSTDAAALMDEVDIVDIVAPPAAHLPLALSALAKGKPVLIEKPAVRTPAEARELIAAAGSLPVQVGLVLRAHPLVERATQILDEGGIGRLLALEGDFSGWKRMRADSSLVENDGVHFLDLMRHFAGAPVAELDARALRLLDPDIADDIVIEARFANGVQGRLRLGVLAGGLSEDLFVPGAMTNKTLRLIGDAGTIVIDFNRNALFHGTVAYATAGGIHDVRPRGLTSQTAIGTTPAALLSRSFDIFHKAVDGKGDVMCDAREGALEIAGVLAAIEKAIARTPPPAIAIGDAA